MRRGMILVLWALAAIGGSTSERVFAAEEDDLMVLAADHYAADRWELAAASFETLLEKGPDAPLRADAIFYRAECLLQMSRFLEAGELYRTFRNEFSDDSRNQLARFRSGEVAYLAEQYPESIEQFEAVLAASPAGPHHLQARVYLAGAILATEEKRVLQADASTDEVLAAEESPLTRAIELFESVIDDPAGDQVRATAQFGRARCLDLHGKASLAATAYLKLRKSPQPTLAAQAHYYLGRLAAASGEPLRAAETWETLIEKWPDSAWAHEVYGPTTAAHLQADQIPEARKSLARWQNAAEGRPSAAQLRHLARLASEAGATDWSLEMYAQLAADNETKTPAATQRLAAAQVEAGRLEEAAETLRKAWDGQEQSAALAVAGLQLAEVYRQLEQAPKGIGIYLQVAERWPETPAAATALRHAAALVIEEKDYVRAAEIFGQLRRLKLNDADRAEALYRHGWALEDAGKPQEAHEAFKALHQNHPESAFWADATYRLAENEFGQGNHEDAQALLTNLLDRAGDGELAPHALYLAGRVAVEGGDWAGAQRPLSGLISRFPDSPLAPSAAYWRAEATFQAGDYPQAADYFEKLTTTSLPTERAARVALRRGQLYARVGKWQAARNAISPLLTEESAEVSEDELYYLLGRCRMADADIQGARTAFLRAAQRDRAEKSETSAMAQWMIGETFMHQKRYAEAAAEYFRVVSLYPHPRWQAAALLQAAQCYERRNQGWDAEKLYRQVIREYPESEFVSPAREKLQAISRGNSGTSS